MYVWNVCIFKNCARAPTHRPQHVRAASISDRLVGAVLTFHVLSSGDNTTAVHALMLFACLHARERRVAKDLAAHARRSTFHARYAMVRWVAVPLSVVLGVSHGRQEEQYSFLDGGSDAVGCARAKNYPKSRSVGPRWL